MTAPYIVCNAENLKIDEQDFGLDFFEPTDRDMNIAGRMNKKYDRQPQSGCNLLSLDRTLREPSTPRHQQPLRFSKSS